MSSRVSIDKVKWFIERQKINRKAYIMHPGVKVEGDTTESTKVDISPEKSQFAISTINALEALHNTGYTHMDVNICFHCIQDEWRAMLISLDGTREREDTFSTDYNQRRRKLFSTGGALYIIRTQFLWRKLDFYGVKPKTRGAPA